MSPNTMPSAASVSPASEDLRSRTKMGSARYRCTAQNANRGLRPVALERAVEPELKRLRQGRRRLRLQADEIADGERHGDAGEAGNRPRPAPRQAALELAARLHRLLRARLGLARPGPALFQSLFRRNARLQRGGGGRLGLGALDGERLAAPLGLAALAQPGGGRALVLLALARGGHRVRVGLGARLRAAPELRIEGDALARRLRRAALALRRMLGLGLQ